MKLRNHFGFDGPIVRLTQAGNLLPRIGFPRRRSKLRDSNIQTTANIFSHLFDGDLKVQDELVFENARKEKQHASEANSFSHLVQFLRELKALGVDDLNARVAMKIREMLESQVKPRVTERVTI